MSTFLVFVGLFVLVVAVVGLIRRRVASARISSRGQAGLALGVGLGLLILAGAVAPSTHPASSGSANLTPAATPTPSPTSAAAASVLPTIPPPRSPAPVQTAPAVIAATPPAAARTTVAPPAAAPLEVAAPVAPAVPVAPAPAPAPAAAGGSTSGDTYTNVDGNQIQGPVQAASRPAGSTARCNDATYSYSQHHSGTCSSHGGVAESYQ